jgi:cell shape-determining protein MreD
LAIIAYIIQTLDTDAVKPLLLLPIVVATAINEEGEMKATLAGAIGGLISDNSSDTLPGYSAIFFIVFCVFSVLIFNNLLRPNVFTFFLFITVYSFIFQMYYFIFYYAIWGYESSGLIFKYYIMPAFIYTSLSAWFIYPISRLINRLRIKNDINVRKR